MSAYGKSHPPHLHGYDPSRTYSGGSYQFNTPLYGSQSTVPLPNTTPILQNATQMSQMIYASNPARSSYDEQSGPFLNVGSTPIPEVASYAPAKGPGGTKLFVGITTLYELMTTNQPIFFFAFGKRRRRSSLARTGQHGGVCSYTLSVEAPQFVTTGSSTSQVPLTMIMETGDGDVIAKVDVGTFTYVERGVTGGNPSMEATRKRKFSAESVELMKSPVKRVSDQQLRPKEEYSNHGFASTDVNEYGASSYLQNSSSYGNLSAQYHLSAGAYQGQNPSRNMGLAFSNSSHTSPIIKAQSPQVTNWTSGFSNSGSSVARSPVNQPNPNSRPALTSLSSPASVANPPLIRTSTIQQTPSPASTPHGVQHFNAYALYPNKAKLEISGDLDAMALNWSEQEWEAKRRLVCFQRSQSGSTITISFKPVTVDDRPPNSVCISCIYWEEKNECFVTSVDTISLLEQIIAARFTVEEKNRIRRNLEGFRPLTVSKGKQDSEEFFKVIMAFPSPKPRNIEKDVKVFHWNDLSSALKKILGKYSASPASTLPPAPILTPASSTGYTTTESAGISYVSDHHGAVSPQSISGSASSTAYTSNIPGRVASPHHQKAMLPQQNGPPDLRVSVVSHPHEASSQWQGSQHHMPTPQQQYQQNLGNQSARNSWDQMSTYLENHPANAGGIRSAQTLSYPASGPRNMTDSAASGDDNRIRRLSLQEQHQSHRISRS